jgi:hypothetical protein
MGKKGITIWVFSTLTFVSLLHLIDASYAFLFNSPAQILRLYPFINTALQQMSIDIYLYAAVASTIVLWGITCLIAFDNPVEAFLNKVLSDANKQREQDNQILESKSDFFDMMYEKAESNGETLTQLKGLVLNVRAEIKDLQDTKETTEKMRSELVGLKNQMMTLEEKLIFPLLCGACGKPLRTDFKLCPYCGEDANQGIIVVKGHKLPKT